MQISTMGWTIIIGFGALAVYAIMNAAASVGEVSVVGDFVCTQCGTRGYPKKRTRGTFALEAGLWIGGVAVMALASISAGGIVMIVALIYSLWRMFVPRETVCPVCSMPGMIGVETPRGQQLLAQFDTTGTVKAKSSE